MPFDAKDAPETSYVKCVDAMLLLGIFLPCPTAVQQGAVFPHPVGQSGHGGRSFADAFVDLDIGGQVAGDG